MSKVLTLLDKRRLLHSAFEKSMSTGGPQGSVALRLLSEPRRQAALGSPDQDLAALSRFVSGGRNTVLSMAYLNASLNGLDVGTPARRAAFEMMLKTGSPFPGMSIFSDWRND